MLMRRCCQVLFNSSRHFCKEIENYEKYFARRKSGKPLIIALFVPNEKEDFQATKKKKLRSDKTEISLSNHRTPVLSSSS